MEIWDQPLETRIAAAQDRLFIERCRYLHRPPGENDQPTR
jgi:hypothetical protein